MRDFMKKILSAVLAAVMLLSTLCCVNVAADDASEDLTERFNDLTAYILYYGTGDDVSKFTADDMVYWVEHQYPYKDYTIGNWENGAFVENSEGMIYAYPADKFNEIAHILFDFDGEFKNLIGREFGEDTNAVYDETLDKIVVDISGKGGVSYRQLSYNETGDNVYDVYFQGGYWGDTDIIWLEEYIHVTAEIVGDYLKVYACEDANIPAVNDEDKALCDSFDILYGYIINYDDLDKDISVFTADDMGYWIQRQYIEVYDDYKYGFWEDGKFTESEDFGFALAYPADKFETIAHLIFDFEGTFKDKMQKEASFSTNIAYDAASDSIVTFYGGKGGAYFKQNGYVNNNDGTYSVFFQEGDWDENGNEFFYDRYRKLTVEFKEKFLKVIKYEKLDSIASEDRLITPKEVGYELDGSLSIDGFNAFPDGTNIFANAIESDDAVSAAKEILGLSENDNIALFDIYADWNNINLQPIGQVKLTFFIPDKLSADNLKLFRINEDGSKQRIALDVEKEYMFASTKLDSFGIYVFCNYQSTADDVLLGDVNLNGTVDVTDALLTLQHSVGKITLVEDELLAAKVSDDGKDVSVTDALLILQKAVNKIDIFPIEKVN